MIGMNCGDAGSLDTTWALLATEIGYITIKKSQHDFSATSRGFHQLSKEPAREDRTCEGYRGLHKPAGASERCPGATVAPGWWIRRPCTSPRRKKRIDLEVKAWIKKDCGRCSSLPGVYPCHVSSICLVGAAFAKVPEIPARVCCAAMTVRTANKQGTWRLPSHFAEITVSDHSSWVLTGWRCYLVCYPSWVWAHYKSPPWHWRKDPIYRGSASRMAAFASAARAFLGAVKQAQWLETWLWDFLHWFCSTTLANIC